MSDNAYLWLVVVSIAAVSSAAGFIYSVVTNSRLLRELAEQRREFRHFLEESLLRFSFLDPEKVGLINEQFKLIDRTTGRLEERLGRLDKLIMQLPEEVLLVNQQFGRIDHTLNRFEERLGILDMLIMELPGKVRFGGRCSEWEKIEEIHRKLVSQTRGGRD